MSRIKQEKLNKVKKQVKRYIEILVEDGFPITQAYIFGSYARGNFRKYSDIDVCIVSPKLRKNWNKNEAYLWRKTLEVDHTIEPIGYSPEGFKEDFILGREIRKNGVRIV